MWRVDELAADFRQGARLVRLQPVFSAIAAATLALGLGGATAVFTLVNAVLLRALPFREPSRLVWLYNARTERDRAPFSIADLDDYAREASTLEGLAAFTNWTATLTGAGEPERLEGTRVSGAFFPLLAPMPLLGRTLQPADEAADARVVVLTHGLWTRRFGADAAVVGRSVVLNGAAFTVVGVMPPRFLFPFRDAELAVPLALASDARRADRGANFLRVVARLAPGATLPAAKADLDRIARRLQQQYPADDARKIGVNVYPLHAEIVSDYRPILWTLFGAVAVLVVVGCGNLANLVLLRAVGRQEEWAIREALGASRGRIARQLVIEAAVLGAVGATGGAGFAWWAVDAWRVFGPSAFPHLADLSPDFGVLAFGTGLALLAVVLCGTLPAVWVARDLATAAETRMTAGRRRQTPRRAFVTLQVAGATVLLVSMGLVGRSFVRLTRVDPGFTPGRAVSMQLALPPNRYGTRESIRRFHDALRSALQRVPGVSSVGAVSLMPLSGLLSAADVAFPGRPAPPPDEVPQAHFRIAGAGYATAVGLRLVEGREFRDDDGASAEGVAMVSRTFAERHWPGRPAAGQYLQIVLAAPSRPLRVVGVVGDVKQFDLSGTPTADVYVPVAQMPDSQAAALAARMSWVIRTEDDVRAMERSIREAVRRVDADVAASGVRTLEDVVAASVSARQTNVRLLELFGQIALVLVAAGVYSLAAFSARERRRELAIRSAVGAQPRGLLLLMMREELVPIALGIGIGLAAALVGARWLAGVLFDTSPWEPGPYVIVAAAMLVVGMLAIGVPVRRAAHTNPAELLR
jgi:predicted permease